MAVATQDFKAAFDDMDHASMLSALRHRAASVCAVSNLIRLVTGLQARLSILTAGKTDWFPIESVGKQGGIETPDEWNALLEYVMLPLAQQWKQRCWGAKLDTYGRTLVTQVTWAGKFFLFSSDLSELQTTCQEPTAAIHKAHLRWKEDRWSCSSRIPILADPGTSKCSFRRRVPCNNVEKGDTISI